MWEQQHHLTVPKAVHRAQHDAHLFRVDYDLSLYTSLQQFTLQLCCSAERQLH